MHKNFADWYNAVSLRPGAETLELRWQAVEVLADELKLPDVPGLIRAFSSMDNTGPYLETIRTAARNKDQTYISDDDQNELMVLAGGVIASVVSKYSTKADAVALAISCIGAQGLRKRPLLQGVVDAAMRYLADESVRVRAAEEHLLKELDVSALSTVSAQRAGVPTADLNSIGTGFDLILKWFLAEYAEYANSVAASISSLGDAQLRQREETDILWWLFGEHTNDGSKAFSDLTVPEACVWGARDLASLTAFLPGPIAAPAFLHKMLRLVKPKQPEHLKLSESVDACELGWKQKLAGAVVVQEIPDLCPMLFAIMKSVEVGGAPTWTAAFEFGTRLKADRTLAPVRLAMQVYNESLLLRALAVKG